jgi:adenine-specific DNA methylase
MSDDRRLTEDYLPIEAISAEASGEPRTKGHISTIHIWRVRRPLAACRAAVYRALVRASADENSDFHLGYRHVSSVDINPYTEVGTQFGA